MFDRLLQLPHTLLSFFIVLSIVVFIHEFGHYLVAKLCGVKIEAFSIGFGKEIFGRTDASGTRWKVALLPLGGYVKMFGDSSSASTADTDALEQMPDEERKLTFHYKPLYKKVLIVAAGPFSNFLLTIIIFSYFILTSGLPSIDPVVGSVVAGSPAEEAGLKPGDRIERINNEPVENFNDIVYAISTNVGTPVHLHAARAGSPIDFTLTPKETEDDDGLGNKIKRPMVGIKSRNITYEEVGPLRALAESVRRTTMICSSTLKVVGQMITGQRSAADLRGPIGIAQLSGQATHKDFHTTLWLIAMISANLGLVNLFPIPLLDGGHLAYYGIEGLRGRPMAQKMQEYGFKAGFVILFCLMAFSLWNDLAKLL